MSEMTSRIKSLYETNRDLAVKIIAQLSDEERCGLVQAYPDEFQYLIDDWGRLTFAFHIIFDEIGDEKNTDEETFMHYVQRTNGGSQWNLQQMPEIKAWKSLSPAWRSSIKSWISLTCPSDEDIKKQIFNVFNALRELRE